MALSIGLVLLAVIVVLLVIISTRQASFRIARSAQIDAPASSIFPLLNDFHHWSKWSPWENLDPTMKKTFEGPASGTGARYAWAGNNKAGEGSMTILDSQPDELLAIKLQFLKPFAATNQTTFKLVPSAGGTEVHWIMEGEHGFSGKAFALFVNMDQFMGKQFEQGLSSLSTAARSA
jgi:uncharacterized protein YndB with AHSA1/START domain